MDIIHRFNAKIKHINKILLKNKKELLFRVLFYAFTVKLSLFYVEDLLAVVVAANLAYAVGLKHLTA